jgi:predicted XRE-type DNA-binding protein
MVRALAGFAADWKLGAEDPGQSEHANSKKGLLTDSSQLCNRPSDMKSEMRKITLQKVLADVRLLVSARGMKARLAADLGVPRPRISGWMAGTRKPSGETALRLARWAELQGRKSK